MEKADLKMMVGRREYVSFPQFNIRNVVAKIDSGAYNGCIHADIIGEVERDGKKFLQFSLLDTSHPEYKDTVHETPDYTKKRVRDANGVTSPRYIIRTPLVIGSREMHIKIGLNNRTNMHNPVLIGRVVLSSNFLVDASKEFLAGKI